jgi:hypothetical protein
LAKSQHLCVLYATQPAAVNLPSVAPQGQHLTIIALKSGNTLTVTHYRVDSGNLNYVLSTGAEGSVDTQYVNWSRTSQLNSQRNATSALGPVQGVD